MEKAKLHKTIANMKVSELQELLHKTAITEECKTELVMFEQILRRMNAAAIACEASRNEEGE